MISQHKKSSYKTIEEIEARIFEIDKQVYYEKTGNKPIWEHVIKQLEKEKQDLNLLKLKSCFSYGNASKQDA